MKKIMLGIITVGVASAAMAQTSGWQRINFNNKEVALYMDVGSIKPSIDEYNNRYLEVKVSRAYSQPKKTASGKFYTHYNETLFVDCTHGAYAASHGARRINNKDVEKVTIKEPDWNKYDSQDSGSYAVTSRAVCKQYKSFLG